jgi:phosphomannomutase
MLPGSGTEPILRIYAESKSPKQVNALLKVGVGLTKSV